jgi:hypothetical protein
VDLGISVCKSTGEGVVDYDLRSLVPGLVRLDSGKKRGGFEVRTFVLETLAGMQMLLMERGMGAERTVPELVPRLPP